MTNQIEIYPNEFENLFPEPKLLPTISVKSWASLYGVGSSQADQRYARWGSGGRSQPGVFLGDGIIAHACRDPNNLKYKLKNLNHSIKQTTSQNSIKLPNYYLKNTQTLFQISIILLTVTLSACASIQATPIQIPVILQKQSDLLRKLKTERNGIEQLKLFKLVPELEKAEEHLQDAIEALIESNKVLQTIERQKRSNEREN